MRVTLACGNDEVTIWFAATSSPPCEHSIERLLGAWLLFDGRALVGLRLIGLVVLCPYELAKVVRAHARREVHADLAAIYDHDRDEGYVYIDQRGLGSVSHTIPAALGVNVDLGHDGTVIGLEIFSPSRLLPELLRISAPPG
jgi:uncharacterized protein YuzE